MATAGSINQSIGASKITTVYNYGMLNTEAKMYCNHCEKYVS